MQKEWRRADLSLIDQGKLPRQAADQNRPRGAAQRGVMRDRISSAAASVKVTISRSSTSQGSFASANQMHQALRKDGCFARARAAETSRLRRSS